MANVSEGSAAGERLGPNRAVDQSRATVVLGHSYFLRFDPKLWAAMQPYPPLGTLYAASFLRERGYDVVLCDTMLAESEDEWTAALGRHRPRFAVLFEDNFNYLSKMCLLRMREAALTMIGTAHRLGCTVIAGGADASDHPEHYLAAGADFVLLGEGEATLAELLDSLTGPSATRPEHILGLAFVDGAGAVTQTARRPVLRDLDAVPFPAWDLVDLDRYREAWLPRHGSFSVNMVTTRGCPYHCNWCAKPIWGQRYNSRSPENVVAEMQWLHETVRPDHVSFVDDIFGLKPGWLQSFADRLDAAGFQIPFRCLSRADLLHRDGEVEALYRAGGRMVWIGAESGSQRILDAMDKGTTVEQIRGATRRLRQAGLQVGFFLQFGYPGETRADIEQTLSMVRECEPDDVGVSVSYPLPGTRFFESVREQLGAKQNWVDSGDLAMMYRGPFTTAFYRQLHTVVHTEFRARRAWNELRPLLARPWRWRRSHLRLGAAWLYRTVSLPLARARLRWLGRGRSDVLAPPRPMRLAEAARPSPQEGDRPHVEGRPATVARRAAEPTA